MDKVHIRTQGKFNKKGNISGQHIPACWVDNKVARQNTGIDIANKACLLDRIDIYPERQEITKKAFDSLASIFGSTF